MKTLMTVGLVWMAIVTSAQASGPPTLAEMQYVQALHVLGKSEQVGFEEFGKTKGGNPTLARLLAATAACHVDQIESWNLPDEAVRPFTRAMTDFLETSRSFFDAWAAGEVGRANDLGKATQDAYAAVESSWKRLEPRYEGLAER